MRRPGLSSDPEVVLLSTGHLNEGLDYWTWRPTGSRSALLVLSLAGSGRYLTRAGEGVVRASEALLLEPGNYHEYGTNPSAGRWELLWVHFHARIHWSGFLDWPVAGAGARKVTVTDSVVWDEICRDWHATHEEASFGTRWSEPLAMTQLERLLIRLQQQVGIAMDPSKEHPAVRKAIEFMARNYVHPIGVPDIAEAVGLSQSRLSHVFYLSMATSPRKYLEQVRLESAKRLLQMSMLPVRIVAEKCGYTQESYFSARFRLGTGLSPSEYRRRTLRS